MKTLRPFVRRYHVALTLVVGFFVAFVVIFVALTAAFVLRERSDLSLVALSLFAATAITGVRLALDMFVRVFGVTPIPETETPTRTNLPRPTELIDQTERMDELMRLNTKLAAVNRDLEQAKEQIERLDTVKTDFITIASHELRTPLAQMRGYTDIIDALNESGTLDNEKIGGLASNLRRAAERMEELIGAMLDTSQLDVNAMDLRYTPTTMETIVRMAIDPLGDALRERKIMLRAAGLSGLPAIQGDLQRLVQATRNVIVNSLKFTPDGGRIEIIGDHQPASGNTPEMVHLTIKDNGVGIAEKDIELIFHKFYRAYDPSRHSTGAYKFMGAGPGLGLTIARGIIAGHGGRIWAESPGHDMNAFPGSTFHILLPLTPPEDARRILPFGDDEGAPVSETASALSEAAPATPADSSASPSLQESTDAQANEQRS